MKVAYFSMEFAVDDRLPIYAGGLGVLAGDHLKSASDLQLPLVAVGLLYRQGYFTQVIDEDGRQREEYPEADLSGVGLVKEDVTVEVDLAGETTRIDVWRLDVGNVPLYLLESDALVPRLYTIDREERIRQEVVIGVAGVRALKALGHEPTVYHLNEGHAAFASLERIRERGPRTRPIVHRLHHAHPRAGGKRGLRAGARAALRRRAGRAGGAELGLPRAGRRGRPDAARPEDRGIRERRLRTARRGLARDVARLRDRVDNERGARPHLAEGHAARREQARPHRLRPRPDGRRARPRPVDDRLHAAFRHLQARDAPLPGARPTRGAPRPGRGQRQGPSGRRRWQGTDRADHRTRARATLRGTHRLRPELQHGGGLVRHLRLGHLAEQPPPADGGLGNERHEGGDERRPEPVRPGRLVAGGLLARDRLGDSGRVG